MTCNDVAFANGLCRIEVTDQTCEADWPIFVARIWLITEGDEGRTLHSLVAADGRPIEIHGSSDAFAIGSATTFLAGCFGALSEYAHRCEDFGRPPRTAEPVVLEGTFY